MVVIGAEVFVGAWGKKFLYLGHMAKKIHLGHRARNLHIWGMGRGMGKKCLYLRHACREQDISALTVSAPISEGLGKGAEDCRIRGM